jgi:hypothetical protein
MIMSANAGKRKLSGAGRRKMEKQKEALEGELLKKIPKVNTYFSAQPHSFPQISCTPVSSELTAHQEELLTEETSRTLQLEEEDNDNARSPDMTEQGQPGQVIAFANTGVTGLAGQTFDEDDEHDSDVKFPPTTDIAHFGTRTLTAAEKQFIVRATPTQGTVSEADSRCQ